MGNRMQYLLDRNEYIENINNLIISDDLDFYNKSLKQMKNGHLAIAEGLITTHPASKSIDIIKQRFPYLTVNIEDGEIYIEGDFSELKEYIPLFNNLGYFISVVTIDGINWITDFKDDTTPFALYLEARYDVKIIDIPKTLYHASPLKFKDKILKNGLVLKSKNKISIHPSRIYLTKDILTAKLFTKQFDREYSKHFDDGFVIYSISGDVIYDLYSDVNLRNGGYYITHNINPDNIKIAFQGKFNILELTLKNVKIPLMD